jgi:hypothetical protein
LCWPLLSRGKQAKRECGNAVLDPVRVRGDRRAEGPRGQDGEQQPGDRPGIQVGADAPVGLATPDQVRQVTGDGAGRPPRGLGQLGLAGMRHAQAVDLTSLAEAAGFRVEAAGDLPMLRYIRAVR